jgi:hypothetical protein
MCRIDHGLSRPSRQSGRRQGKLPTLDGSACRSLPLAFGKNVRRPQESPIGKSLRIDGDAGHFDSYAPALSPLMSRWFLGIPGGTARTSAPNLCARCRRPGTQTYRPVVGHYGLQAKADCIPRRMRHAPAATSARSIRPTLRPGGPPISIEKKIATNRQESSPHRYCV